jgi:hypothetical protein
MSVLIWIVAIVVLLILLFVVAPILFFAFSDTRPEGVTVDIVAPARVRSGQEFDVVVTVVNGLEKERTLRSVDFETSILKGFEVAAIEPEPVERSSMLGTTAFHYTLPIAAQARVAVTLHCRALGSGEYAGRALVYVDSKNVKSVDEEMKIVVE